MCSKCEVLLVLKSTGENILVNLEDKPGTATTDTNNLIKEIENFYSSVVPRYNQTARPTISNVGLEDMPEITVE